MSPEDSKHALDIFDRSLLVPVEERPGFLQDACSGNAELRKEVESLLAVAEDADSFLEKPLQSLPEADGDVLQTADAVGKYRIERQLGEGGMGAVYLARRDEPGFNVQAAIKMLRPGKDGEEIISRFLREHEILAKLDHPNIAKPFDRGTTDEGLPYLVMEYVDGIPIDEYCDKNKLSTAGRLRLFRKVCTTVHFAHQNLVIHRDLKPANILVTPQGEPKLLDFGVAGLIEPSPFSTSAETLHRTAGGFFGTLRYASPEQVRNKEALTTASDVYSLGVLLYELLSGHYPYEQWSDSFLELSNAICTETPERPSTVVGRRKEVRSTEGDPQTLTPETVSATRGGDPGRLRRRLTGDLDKIVLKALDKDPTRRYASADELSDDLERHLEGLPVSAQEPTFSYQLAKFVRRHTGHVVTGAGVILMILAFGLLAMFLWQKEKETRDRVERALMVSDYLVELFSLDDLGTDKGNVPVKDLLADGLENVDLAMQMDDLSEAEKDWLKSQIPSDLPGLMDALGWAHYGVGDYEEADRLLTEGLRRRRSGGSRDDDLAVHLIHLAATRTALGLKEEAEPLQEEGLDILRSGEVDDLRLSQLLQRIGNLLRRRGNLELAADVQREALAMTRRVEGEDDAGVWQGLNNLGAALAGLGRYEEAEAAYREALALKAERYGADSRELETLQANLANVLGNVGRVDESRRDAAWTEAEELLRKILDRRRAEDPPRPLRVASALRNLAAVLQYRGKLDEAEAMFDETLEIVRRERGEGDPRVATVLRNRATLYQQMGRAEEAEREARQALEAFEEIYGAGHWQTAYSESVLGGCLLDLDRVDEAEPLLEGSQPVLEAELGEHHAVTLQARERLERLDEKRAGASR